VTDDETGADEGIGEGFHGVEKFEGFGFTKSPFHDFEHFVVDVLDGHIEVVVKNGRIADGFDEFEGRGGGVEIENPRAFDPVDEFDPFDEVNQSIADVLVTQIGAGILRDEAKIVVPFGDESLYFTGYTLQITGIEFPLKRGDSAETARLIAPFRELDVGMIGRTRHDPLGTIDEVNFGGKTALFGSKKLVDFVIIPHTGKNIHFAEFLGKFLFVPLTQTSCHHQNRLFFPSCIEVKNGIERLLFGSVDKSTRIDNDYIRLRSIVG